MDDLIQAIELILPFHKNRLLLLITSSFSFYTCTVSQTGKQLESCECTDTTVAVVCYSIIELQYGKLPYFPLEYGHVVWNFFYNYVVECNGWPLLYES